MSIVTANYFEATDIVLTSTYTDSAGVAANPSAVVYTVYRDDESAAVQTQQAASVAVNVATITVNAANVRVGAGKTASILYVEIDATIGARQHTDVFQCVVRNMRSKT